MNWSFLPPTHAENKAAFFDSDSAARWLAGQPQANAVAMLAGLLAQIDAFNTCRVAPRERFASLEVLRKSVFAVCGESLRRFEHKALPLLPGEQLAFDQTRRLWRACALAYLHCLCAALANDPAIVDQSALVAHRALSCLRQEQMSCYLAGGELDDDFWTVAHALWAAAEALGITRSPLADPLLRETLESTVSGQYAMALLLHLARPSSLSRAQLAATSRWFSRWREQAKVQRTPDAGPESCALALDLSSAAPFHDQRTAAGVARWLSLGKVLRKMRERRRLLAAGESPESLKLGGGLSSAECTALLVALDDRLSDPQVAKIPDQGESIVLAAGLENAYRLLGGIALKEEASSFTSQLIVDQLAVFGHVVRELAASGDSAAELWRLVRRDDDQVQLTRNAADGARLLLRSLLVIRLPADGRQVLATVNSLCSRRDGRLCVSASLLAGTPTALLAEVREKPAGMVTRHPAVLLSNAADATRQIFLPAGLPGRALAIRFFDSTGQPLPGLVLADCAAHGGDSERWSVAR
ncbi:MAG: hypothetical protein H6R17_228 [Proteobacteria bacterium]|nr:hypothetical protein [Pseudomonadota bacterium]